MTTLSVKVAYSRNLKTKEQVQEHYDKGKDFVVVDIESKGFGSYINKEDAEKECITLKVRYRYDNNVVTIKPRRGISNE